MQSKISSLFHKKNIRQTLLRTELLQMFMNEKTPFTVPEIQLKMAKKQLTPNKTSLYRHLNTFVENKLIQKIVLNAGVVHYEYQEQPHHHFSCEECNTIECLIGENFENQIKETELKLSKTGHTQIKHCLSLSGICQNCS